jgi:hypothetical protein
MEVAGIPLIAWNLDTVRSLLGPSAWVERLGVEMATRSDLGRFRVMAWTDNPASLPRSKLMWVEEPLLYGEDDEDLLAPPDAIIPEEVAFLEFTATVHLVRLEDTNPSLDWPTPGADPDDRDYGDDGHGHGTRGRQGAGGGGLGPGGRGDGVGDLPRPPDPLGSHRRWGGGRERRVALGHTSSVLPWPRFPDADDDDVADTDAGSLSVDRGDADVAAGALAPTPLSADSRGVDAVAAGLAKRLAPLGGGSPRVGGLSLSRTRSLSPVQGKLLLGRDVGRSAWSEPELESSMPPASPTSSTDS